ncbi:MAG: AAA family ATPase [Epsilonproteobacteria bacterium]|nr:AAA family ATPase [Campylobacterota bacterium]
MKKLPIGISTFSIIREEDYIYVDKTKEAYELITNYKYTFLSRPRRFGKSLFLDTLFEIFRGNKELFKGLFIYDKWSFEKYPVIKISFSGDLRSPEGLKNRILDILKRNQDNLKVKCDKNTPYDSCFEELIEKSYQKYKKGVVILIDEYDKAILDNLDQIEIAKENREILKSFYGIIKDNDRYIKFVFLTGVSKFSKASIFSGLNNLRDITLSPPFGNICGYTQEDIDNVFLPYLKGVNLDKLKEWYNGYYFLKDKVYNPFDILLFIDNHLQFDNYWFNTGTPSFLIKLFEKGTYNLAKFENLKVSENLLDAFDIESITLETVMFQSGYLTIKEVVRKRLRSEYILTFPNLETKISFNDYLLTFLVKNTVIKNEIQSMLIDIFENANLDKLKDILQSLFASIAYNNFSNNYIQNYEGFYSSVIYAYFAGAGFDKVIAEDVTNDGRIDLSIFIDKKVFILEFKVDGKGALEQIKEKEYFKKYLQNYEEVYIIGIEFDSKSRNLTDFKWERVK